MSYSECEMSFQTNEENWGRVKAGRGSNYRRAIVQVTPITALPCAGYYILFGFQSYHLNHHLCVKDLTVEFGTPNNHLCPWFFKVISNFSVSMPFKNHF